MTSGKWKCFENIVKTVGIFVSELRFNVGYKH